MQTHCRYVDKQENNVYDIMYKNRKLIGYDLVNIQMFSNTIRVFVSLVLAYSNNFRLFQFRNVLQMQMV